MAAISLSPKSTAALLRKILKGAFPATKFSVVTERGSMVSSVRVTWTDGPTQTEVKKFTSAFEMGRFDGMTDSYDYDKREDRQLLVDGVHYESGCKYVFEVRHISAELANKCIKQVAEFWGGVEEPLPVAIEGYCGFTFEDPNVGRRTVRSDLDSNRHEWYSSVRRAAENAAEFTHSNMEG